MSYADRQTAGRIDTCAYFLSIMRCFLWTCLKDRAKNKFQNTVRSVATKTYEIGKIYSFEYTDIPKVFFTSYNLCRCCTNVTRRHCCVLGHSYTNVIPGHCCTTLCSNNGKPWTHCCVAMGKNATSGPIVKNATGTNGLLWCCSSLALDSEEHLKMAAVQVNVMSINIRQQ
jgi:hypothetical protein